jgi:hypothetical protein
MHPLACAGLSFAVTASLLIWDVFDEPDCSAVHGCSARAIGTSAGYAPALPPTTPDDPLCDDPRIATRRMIPQARVWLPESGAICP